MISTVTVHEGPDVNRDDIPFLQRPITGNTMHHFIVDARATRCRKALIPLKGRYGSFGADVFFNPSVNLHRRYARLQSFPHHSHRLSYEATRPAHRLQLGLRFQNDHWTSSARCSRTS